MTDDRKPNGQRSLAEVYDTYTHPRERFTGEAFKAPDLEPIEWPLLPVGDAVELDADVVIA